MNTEGSLGVEEQYDIFENETPSHFELIIEGVKNGEYRFKETKLNREHGSILDEWLKFGALKDIKLDEVVYLKQICVPHIQVHYVDIYDETIKINTVLKPHEVQLFELNLIVK